MTRLAATTLVPTAARTWAAVVVSLLLLLAPGCSGPVRSSVAREVDPEAVIASLLARPAQGPAGSPGACTTSPPLLTPVHPLGGYFGPDPLQLRWPRGTDGLYEVKVVWATGPGSGYTGPVVLRVVRLDAPGRGLVRLYYDDSASRGDAVVLAAGGSDRSWPSGTFVSDPGCYAYRLDGRTFTDFILFRTELAPAR